MMTCSRCSGVCTCTPAPGSAALQTDLLPRDDSAAWRQEVSERLHRYRARRRPRGPRYPSLRLKFDAETSWAAGPRETAVAPEGVAPVPITPAVTMSAVAMDYVEAAAQVEARAPRPAEVPKPAIPRRHEPAKVIEFPAPTYTVEDFSHALAEPMLDRPRILEAPEVVPPPPAMGGITIEPAAQAEPERQAGIDMPLQSAPSADRILAGAVDLLLVVAATGVFGAVFYRLTLAIPALSMSAYLGTGVLALFWFVYQYLFLVHCATTPGLRVLKVRLQRFDGRPAGRRLRRARVLCQMLSLGALGMGYAWQFLDEDGLCWHERVTRTHTATRHQEASAVP